MFLTRFQNKTSLKCPGGMKSWSNQTYFWVYLPVPHLITVVDSCRPWFRCGPKLATLGGDFSVRMLQPSYISLKPRLLLSVSRFEPLKQLRDTWNCRDIVIMKYSNLCISVWPTSTGAGFLPSTVATSISPVLPLQQSSIVTISPVIITIKISYQLVHIHWYSILWPYLRYYIVIGIMPPTTTFHQNHQNTPFQLASHRRQLSSSLPANAKRIRKGMWCKVKVFNSIKVSKSEKRTW